ncbi:MAG: hypothetical protein ACNA8L_01565 [Luteolibacter sp.]
MMKAAISRFLVIVSFVLAMPFHVPTAQAAEERTLIQWMEEFDMAYRGFRRETDPEKGLPIVREGQVAFLQSMALLPPMVEKMPAGAAKDKAAATYRNMMAEVYLMLTRLELAFLERDMEAVAGHVGEIRNARRAGHDRFMEE